MGQPRGRGAVRGGRVARGISRVELPRGARHDRRAHRRRQRGRFHDPRRLLRDVSPREERAGRTDGRGVRAAARASARRHRRRRLGGRDRAARRHLCALRAGLRPGRRQPRARSGRRARPRVGRGPWCGAARREPLLIDGARSQPDVHGGSAGRGGRWRKGHGRPARRRRAARFDGQHRRCRRQRGRGIRARTAISFISVRIGQA